MKSKIVALSKNENLITSKKKKISNKYATIFLVTLRTNHKKLNISFITKKE